MIVTTVNTNTLAAIKSTATPTISTVFPRTTVVETVVTPTVKTTTPATETTEAVSTPTTGDTREDMQLSVWQESTFAPTYNTIKNLLKGVNADNFVSVANQVQDFIDVTRAYIVYTQKNGETGFTGVLIQARNSFLQSIAMELEKTIETLAGTLGIALETSAVTKELSTASYSMYKFAGSTVSLTGKQYTATTEAPNYTPTTATEDTTTATPKKSNTIVWVAGSVAAGLVLISLAVSAGKEQDKQPKNKK